MKPTNTTLTMGALTLVLAAFAAPAALAGCGGDDVIKAPPKPSGTPAAAAPPPAAPAPPAPGSPAGAKGADGGAPNPLANLPKIPPKEFGERDFQESDSNRDPFHSFAADLVAQNKKTFVNQRKVLVDRYALEELKLEGLVIGAPSRALLVDPTGFGWIAKVGDLIGKPELIRSTAPGGGGDVPINWRVDRIRPNDVVFVREDPAHPEIPPTTRSIPLRPMEDNVLAKGQGVTLSGRQ